MRRRSSHGAWRTFRWPLALAVASVAGLLSALLGDGAADTVSWVLLGALPLVIALGYMRER